MVFGNFIYAIVLFLNAICVLSEDRFLARIGWSAKSHADPAFGQSGPDQSVKSKIVSLITSVRMIMRVPLIFINTLIIVYELILG